MSTLILRSPDRGARAHVDVPADSDVPDHRREWVNEGGFVDDWSVAFEGVDHRFSGRDKSRPDILLGISGCTDSHASGQRVPIVNGQRRSTSSRQPATSDYRLITHCPSVPSSDIRNAPPSAQPKLSILR